MRSSVGSDGPMARKKITKPGTTLIPAERIERSILLIRGEKVLLDRDLADLYQVETRALIQAVKRTIGRFPADFMFQLSTKELEDWRSQFVMSHPSAKIGLRRRPYAFTDQGVAMLSSVLNSDRAVEVNIEIMRAFSACGRCWPLMKNWPASSTRSRRSMTPSFGWTSTRSVS